MWNTDPSLVGVADHVQKDLSNFDEKLKKKISRVKEKFRAEIEKMSAEYCEEIAQLKKENHEVKMSKQIVDDKASEKLRIVIEQLKASLRQNEQAYEEKVSQCEEYEALIREEHQKVYTLQVEMNRLKEVHSKCDSARIEEIRALKNSHDNHTRLQNDEIERLNQTIEDLYSKSQGNFIAQKEEEIATLKIRHDQAVSKHKTEMS